MSPLGEDVNIQIRIIFTLIQNILFICGGAFDGIEKDHRTNECSRSGDIIQAECKEDRQTDLMKYIQPYRFEVFWTYSWNNRSFASSYLS